MTATSDGGHLAELRGTTWDAIVVGAGPAGSLAARRLSRAGASVLLVEKKCFPRPKVCGACLSPSALTELDRAGLGSLAAQLDAVELGEFHFRFRHRSLRMAMSGGKALSRERLDEALARSAVEAGARLLEGTLAQVEPVFNDVRRVLLSQHGRCARVRPHRPGRRGIRHDPHHGRRCPGNPDCTRLAHWRGLPAATRAPCLPRWPGFHGRRGRGVRRYRAA